MKDDLLIPIFSKREEPVPTTNTSVGHVLPAVSPQSSIYSRTFILPWPLVHLPLGSKYPHELFALYPYFHWSICQALNKRHNAFLTTALYLIDQVPLYSEVTELFREHCASIKCQDMGGRYFPISQKKAHTKMREHKYNYGEETLFFKTWMSFSMNMV